MEICGGAEVHFEYQIAINRCFYFRDTHPPKYRSLANSCDAGVGGGENALIFTKINHLGQWEGEICLSERIRLMAS